MKQETAQLDEKGRPKTQPTESKSKRTTRARTNKTTVGKSRVSKTRKTKPETNNPNDVDWQGLTPASNVRAESPQRDVRQEMGEDVIANHQRSDYGRDTENRTPMPDVDAPSAKHDSAQPERGIDIDRSPRPDARDEEKVDRLAAPDWRSEQPLPSARGAIDPRGENTPEELYESEENPNGMPTP
jgi:hypothetical protein